MMKDKGLLIPILAIAVYIIGGIATFSGVGLILLMKGKDLWGWGEGHTIGYLLVFVGLILSILGVLIMRILRNRL
ncbi:MAG: hypothetical protein PF441_08375 [Desulfuromusa sp.]|nr:hypothetical protein [Desulfuromusa sp.]